MTSASLDDARVAVIGLGYVGLPLAAAFGEQIATVGYDIQPERVRVLWAGHDATRELITYAAGFGAEKVIWIAESLREEHRQALEWLNQASDESTHFFGVVVEVLRIDESRPAFNFKVAVSPNEWQKAAKRKRLGPTSERAERYRQFQQALIDDLRENHGFTGARTGQPQNWYEFASGISGIRYACAFGRNRSVRAEIYIDLGDHEKNRQVFDSLLAQREILEQEFGESLDWQRLENKRAARIAAFRDGSIDDDDATLAEIHNWLVDRLRSLHRVFAEPLRQVTRNL